MGPCTTFFTTVGRKHCHLFVTVTVVMPAVIVGLFEGEKVGVPHTAIPGLEPVPQYAIKTGSIGGKISSSKQDVFGVTSNTAAPPVTPPATLTVAVVLKQGAVNWYAIAADGGGVFGIAGISAITFLKILSLGVVLSGTHDQEFVTLIT